MRHKAHVGMFQSIVMVDFTEVTEGHISVVALTELSDQLVLFLMDDSLINYKEI